MAIISTSVFSYTITLDKAALAALAVVQAALGFTSPSNWREVLFIYKNATGGEDKEVTFQNDGAANFTEQKATFSSVGNWQLKSVEIFDYLGNALQLEGNNCPAGNDVLIS